jgi:hypothetical protein
MFQMEFTQGGRCFARARLPRQCRFDS